MSGTARGPLLILGVVLASQRGLARQRGTGSAQQVPQGGGRWSGLLGPPLRAVGTLRAEHAPITSLPHHALPGTATLLSLGVTSL